MFFRFKSWFLFAMSLFLVDCGGEWTSSDNSEAYSCDLGDWSGGTPSRLAVSGDAETVYVLDNYSTVYRYGVNAARKCAYELDRSVTTDGAITLSGFADDIALAGTFLYYNNGIRINRYDDDAWSCDVTTHSMAVQASSMVVGKTAGLEDYDFSSTGCTKQSTSFSGVTRVHTVAANASIVVTAESVTGVSDPPTSISIYDRSTGSVSYRSALSANEDSEMHFCSATRLRLGSSYILLLDAECGNLGVFDYQGTFVHRLDLADLGIRSVADIAVVGDVLYILNGSSYHPLYRLDFSTYSWENETL
ncbi:MAG: hypothetical protein AUK31_04510 [Fibrobacteres bacterium CG2_30_45_31]|nr:MAG: hypothetical protein AUK31_04510 [Fibrobacteres bacterium CG2_30_45_31]